jgi:hypothetical protein
MQNLSSVDKLTSSVQIHKTSFGIIYIALIFVLCYAARGTHYVKKSFIKRTPGANVIKLYTAVSYDFFNEFVPGKPFQPSLLFVGKARSLP